jgi:sugar/nucleoside kinase (ribokinase family)
MSPLQKSNNMINNINPKYSLPKSLLNRPLDILTLGSFVLERVIKLSAWPQAGGQDNVTIESITDTFGGCATSVACFAARFGLKTSLISMIGDDEPCTNALQELHNSGVVTQHMSHHKNERGSLIRILADPHGEWASLSMVNPNLKFHLKDLPPISYFETAKILHIDGYACLNTYGSEEIVLEAVKRANAADCVISVDACVPAAKHATNFLVNLFRRANIVFANLSEAQLLTGTDNIDKIIQSYRTMGVDVGIIKNGIHGSHVTTQTSSIYVPAYQVDIIDSIAAGDAYVAGMLASLCKGFSIIKSSNYASASGALACQGFGSLSNLYTFSHMHDLISQVQ